VLAQQLGHKWEIWRSLIWASFLIIGLEFLIATLRPQRELKLAADGLKPVRPDQGLFGRWRVRIGQALGVVEETTSSGLKGLWGRIQSKVK
jgi:hypothetical protein